MMATTQNETQNINECYYTQKTIVSVNRFRSDLITNFLSGLLPNKTDYVHSSKTNTFEYVDIISDKIDRLLFDRTKGVKYRFELKNYLMNHPIALDILFRIIDEAKKVDFGYDVIISVVPHFEEDDVVEYPIVVINTGRLLDDKFIRKVINFADSFDQIMFEKKEFVLITSA